MTAIIRSGLGTEHCLTTGSLPLSTAGEDAAFMRAHKAQLPLMWSMRPPISRTLPPASNSFSLGRWLQLRFPL